MDRNCHKSIEQGLTLTGGVPVYLKPLRNHYGIIGCIPSRAFTPEAIQKVSSNSFFAIKAGLCAYVWREYVLFMYKDPRLRGFQCPRIRCLGRDSSAQSRELSTPHRVFPISSTGDPREPAGAGQRAGALAARVRCGDQLHVRRHVL